MTKSAPVEFINAVALDGESIYISGSLDALPAYSAHVRLFLYDELVDPVWRHHDVDWWSIATAVFVESDEAPWALSCLSNEGQVEYIRSSGDPIVESIPGAGVHRSGAVRWGYMSNLKQIGDHLYACGGAGQVYKRLGKDHWVHMDEGVLQAPDVDDRLLPSAIDGPHEEAIYLVGALAESGYPPRVHFWNGKTWRQLELPEVAERLTCIYVETETRIWLAGANGTLLLGNAEDGFVSLSSVDDNQLFLGVCEYFGKVYLPSNLGLFVYDVDNPQAGIQEVVTGLTPELQDARIIDRASGVLWSVGGKDIAKFDGKVWTRIQHPDNDPI
ncbi:hypothetical protein ACQ859_16465 [Roseateles chitinivorans]|uniref:hypothetical protein n=1 Tax=Roseateles chitinivorans TaxID=2917965 RepID=UPI003D673E38